MIPQHKVMKNDKTQYYKDFCKKITKEHANYERDRFEDRNVLEEIIFPYILAVYEPKTILDIGREDYQTFYNKFFSRRELWSLDFDPKRKKYGAKRHITDDASNVGSHFEKDYFDFILMNGVFGWGLNDADKIEKTFASIYDILKPGGVFILGWNDTKDLTPVPLTEIEALNKFAPLQFPELENSVQFKCINGDHTYNFFVKN
jgi:SAM-dependent methyltransferase